ncbi:hypothetical protein ACWD0G_21995, partial [Streptomyces goshikiensis]
ADTDAVRGWSAPGPEEVSSRLGGLLSAVGFAMQPRILVEHRGAAEAYLTRHLDEHTWRYFNRRRLASQGLPGGIPAQLTFLTRSPAVRRAVRQVRRVRRLRGKR